MTTTETHRIVVVGAGPAGLQLSYYLQQAGIGHVVLERHDAPGSFFMRYPRHRRLISLNKVHTESQDPEIKLRWDWNSLLNHDEDLHFPRYSQEYLPGADDLVRYLADFQKRHELPVRYSTRVEHISRDETGFEVRTEDGATLRATAVVVACGWGKPNVPRIAGIEHAVGYESVSVDPAAFTGQRVLVLGKGNSAFETAHAIFGRATMVHLASRRPLLLAWNTKHPGDVRGQYGALLDSYQFKTLHSVLDCTVDEIRPVGDHFEVTITYTHADGERAVLEYDTVIRCTGFRMDTDIFDESCRPEMESKRDGRIPSLRADWSSANVDDLYFAGTIAQARDFKRASSAFIDGFRYNLRTLTRLLQERYEDVPLPFGTVAAEPVAMTTLALDRLNWSSALWTQFEYLCDVFVVDEATGEVRHYEDLPEDLATERFADQAHVYTVTLRWGRDEDYPDVFAIERHPTPDRARESAFIHPVVRRHRHGEQIAELHLLEDLLANWRDPERHVAPLERFFTEQFAAAVPQG